MPASNTNPGRGGAGTTAISGSRTIERASFTLPAIGADTTLTSPASGRAEHLFNSFAISNAPSWASAIAGTGIRVSEAGTYSIVADVELDSQSNTEGREADIYLGIQHIRGGNVIETFVEAKENFQATANMGFYIVTPEIAVQPSDEFRLILSYRGDNTGDIFVFRMSATDGELILRRYIGAGATVVAGAPGGADADLSVGTRDAVSLEIANTGGDNVTLPSANATEAGLESAAHYNKTEGIEDNATADQTDAEIKAAYERNADTNVFDDAAQTKLANIADRAERNPTASQIKTLYESNSNTNALTDAALARINALTDAGINALIRAFLSAAVTGNTETNISVTLDASDKLNFVATGGGGGGGVTSVTLSIGTHNATSLEIANSAGANVVLPAASSTLAGLLTAAKSAKLDLLDVGFLNALSALPSATTHVDTNVIANVGGVLYKAVSTQPNNEFDFRSAERSVSGGTVWGFKGDAPNAQGASLDFDEHSSLIEFQAGTGLVTIQNNDYWYLRVPKALQSSGLTTIYVRLMSQDDNRVNRDLVFTLRGSNATHWFYGISSGDRLPGDIGAVNVTAQVFQNSAHTIGWQVRDTNTWQRLIAGHTQVGLNDLDPEVFYRLTLDRRGLTSADNGTIPVWFNTIWTSGEILGAVLTDDGDINIVPIIDGRIGFGTALPPVANHAEGDRFVRFQHGIFELVPDTGASASFDISGRTNTQTGSGDNARYTLPTTGLPANFTLYVESDTVVLRAAAGSFGHNDGDIELVIGDAHYPFVYIQTSGGTDEFVITQHTLHENDQVAFLWQATVPANTVIHATDGKTPFTASGNTWSIKQTFFNAIDKESFTDGFTEQVQKRWAANLDYYRKEDTDEVFHSFSITAGRGSGGNAHQRGFETASGNAFGSSTARNFTVPRPGLLTSNYNLAALKVSTISNQLSFELTGSTANAAADLARKALKITSEGQTLIFDFSNAVLQGITGGRYRWVWRVPDRFFGTSGTITAVIVDHLPERLPTVAEKARIPDNTGTIGQYWTKQVGDTYGWTNIPGGGAVSLPDLYEIGLPTTSATVNRKTVTADSGRVVESDWSPVQFTDNSTPFNGITIASNEIRFASAQKCRITGAFITETDDSGGAGRVYNHFRMEKVGSPNNTVLKQSYNASYNKTTGHDTTAHPNLTQGPREQITHFDIEIDAEAGDAYVLMWRAYIQTSSYVQIRDDDSLLDIRIEAAAGGGGASGQAVTPRYAHPFQITQFGDFANSVVDPTPPNNTWDPTQGFTDLDQSPNTLWAANRSVLPASGMTRWAVTRQFFSAPGTATGWGSRVISKAPVSHIRYATTNTPTDNDYVQGTDARARYVQFWDDVGHWGAWLAIDGRGTRWDTLGHVTWRPVSNADTIVMTLGEVIDSTNEVLFGFWVRVRGIPNLSTTAYLANVLWYPGFIDSEAPGSQSPARGKTLQLHTIADLSAYNVGGAVIQSDNVVPARGQGQNSGFACRMLPRRIAGNPAVSGTFQDIWFSTPSVWGVNTPGQRFQVDISLIAQRTSGV